MKKLILIIVISTTLLNIFGFSTVRKNNKAVKLIQDTLLYNAEEDLEKYLESSPDNPTLNYNYGLVKLKQSETAHNNQSGLESAVESFEKAKADTTKSNLYSTYYNQANAYYGQGNYLKSITNYQEASTLLDSTKIDPDLLYNYANSLYKYAENNPEYDSLYTMAQDIYKSTSGMVDSKHRQKIMHNLGNSAFQQENYQEAVSYYVEALKLDPKSEDTRINYEVALRKLAEQQSQNQQQQDQDQQEKSDDKQEKSEDQQQSQQKQEEEAKEKQDQYDELSKEEKEKLEAEKKLDALLQQQARPEENEEKPKIRQQRPTGKYW